MLTVNYIGTMLPDYLQDHHCRDGQYLLTAPASSDTTFQDVLNGWVDSAFQDDGKIPEKYTDNDIEQTILLMAGKPIDFDTRLWNANLDTAAARDGAGESYAYAYLEWPTD